MKKRLVAAILTVCSVLLIGMPVCANNHEDAPLPKQTIAFRYSAPANTDPRKKEDKSYHYIWNKSGFNLWVRSMDSKASVNLTTMKHLQNDHVIVPTAERFISNYVYESGYRECLLNISTATYGTTGILYGVWSSDSIGNYPVATP